MATADGDSHRQVVYAIEALAEVGPNLDRPLADRIKGSTVRWSAVTALGGLLEVVANFGDEQFKVG
ncbi:MAG: hypothetical protein ACRDTH_23875 [Pseudonocardiaceae bacterium]